uniref:Kinesin motor domain-containing protein n=1 Tax=Kalanchoe fedtschenkoi TaxID=63787 RepID=A0A7N0UNM6_KALFE
MPFISEAASAIKSRFGFHDPHSEPSVPSVKSTPNLMKTSSSKDSLLIQSAAATSAVRSIGSFDDSGMSTSQSFELTEDPSFWKDHNVQVIIRVRPLNNSEISLQGYNKCVRQESSQTITWTGHPEARFTFDAVADETVSQEKLFKLAGVPMVENCVGGYNSCMFAYGQTGSGKTHTMLGDIEAGTRRHSVNCGMTPRVFEYMFQRIQKERESRRDEKLKFTCKCSFLEIYNEQILDLLDPSSNNLQIREDHKRGVYVENLKEVEVLSSRDVMQQLLEGAVNRKVAATNMNLASSRSHSVFTCVIESKWESQGVNHHRFARLHLVDLAGSERQKSSGAEGERLKEATNINKSLSTLGLVIMNLVSISNGRSLHVPYRDSKLTFLLQDSLGGNSKTIIIANISPSVCCSAETLSTLKFAQRAKFIKNNAIVNEDASGDVIALRLQNQQLKKEVARLRSLGSVGHENLESETGSVCVAGSPGSFKWDGLQASFSPLTSDRRTHSKKEYEAAIVAAFRREKDKEMSLQAMAAENQAALQLAKQREDEIRALKMRLRFREAGIKRLEAAVSGKISAESHLLKEKDEYLQEIKVLRAQVDRNQEVTRFAMENLHLKEELRRLQSFVEEGEREMMQRQLTSLQNMLLEALDWKLMNESDSAQKEPGSPWRTSSSEENEFLRMQAFQNQSEIDTLHKKLSNCVEEKNELERKMKQLETELSSGSIRFPVTTRSSTVDGPSIDAGDQMELKTMVEAIAAASQREAEAHETAIFLSREVDELRLKMKTLVEDNNKLIELYERAAAEISIDKDKFRTALVTNQINEDSSNNSIYAEKESQMNHAVEKLKTQLADLQEENERLMELYEKAVQEREDSSNISISLITEKESQMNHAVKKLAQQLADLQEENERLMGLYEKAMQDRRDSSNISSSLVAEKESQMNRAVKRLEQQLAELQEENERLMGLYEKAMQERDDSNSMSNSSVAAKESQMNHAVEQLEHQLADLQEENERLMVMYEKAMQERDEFKKVLFSISHSHSHMKRHADCPENFVEMDDGVFLENIERMTPAGAECPSQVSDVFKLEENGHLVEHPFKEVEAPIEETGTLGSDVQNHLLSEVNDEHKRSMEKWFSFTDEQMALMIADLITMYLQAEQESEIQVTAGNNFDMSVKPMIATAEKIPEGLKLVRKKLDAAEEKLGSSTKCVTVLHTLEKAYIDIYRLSRDVEETDGKLHSKQQELKKLKSVSSEMQEKSCIANQKLTALKQSLSSFHSSFAYYEQREGRAKGRADHALSQLYQKKEEMARLLAYEVQSVVELSSLQQSETGLETALACLKPKLDVENENVLMAIDNLDPAENVNKWIGGKATELLKSEEKLVSLRKEIDSLKRKIAKIEKEKEVVQLEVSRCSKIHEDMEGALQQVVAEKEMLIEMIENGKQEFENMVIEYQQSVFQALCKEVEVEVVEEDLESEYQRIQELQLHRAVIAEETKQLLESQPHSVKLNEELQNAHMSLCEAKALLDVALVPS